MIRVKDLTVHYPKMTEPSLKGVSFEVKEGEMVCVLGSINSGKTTLCMSLNGLVPNFIEARAEGEVIVDELKVEETSLSVMSSRVGMILENPLLQITGYAVTVEEEIAFGLENLGVPRTEMKKRVNEVLNFVGLKNQRNQNPFEISGGQQQRLALASILAMQPKILVFDEPTNQLDPLGTDEVFKQLNKLKGNKTIVLTTQKVEEIIGLADKVLLLHKGRLLAYDSPDNVLTNIKLLKKAGVRIPLIVELQGLKGVAKDKITLDVKKAVKLIRGKRL